MSGDALSHTRSHTHAAPFDDIVTRYKIPQFVATYITPYRAMRTARMYSSFGPNKLLRRLLFFLRFFDKALSAGSSCISMSVESAASSEVSLPSGHGVTLSCSAMLSFCPALALVQSLMFQIFTLPSAPALASTTSPLNAFSLHTRHIPRPRWPRSTASSHCGLRVTPCSRVSVPRALFASHTRTVQSSPAVAYTGRSPSMRTQSHTRAT